MKAQEERANDLTQKLCKNNTPPPQPPWSFSLEIPSLTTQSVEAADRILHVLLLSSLLSGQQQNSPEWENLKQEKWWLSIS